MTTQTTAIGHLYQTIPPDENTIVLHLNLSETMPDWGGLLNWVVTRFNTEGK